MSLLTDGELRLLLDAIEQRTGIHHRPDQLPAVGHTIETVMRAAGIDQPRALVRALDQRAEVYRQLVDAITIGETYFFREPRQFAFIEQEIIPAARRRGGHPVLRAWSAACASGEEAYSLAILCKEQNQAVDILATDIAPEAIAAARRASYRDWSFRGDALRRVQKYLQPSREPGEQQLTAEIRRRVRFQLLNLVSDDYPNLARGTCFFELILCRNALLYFDAATSRQVANRLAECLIPGGWLITASADPALNDLSSLQMVANDYGTFYRRVESGTVAGDDRPSAACLPAPRRWQSGNSVAASAGPPPRGGVAGPRDQPATHDDRSGRPTRTGIGSPDFGPSGSTDHDEERGCQDLIAEIQRLRDSDLPAAIDKSAELAGAYPLTVSLHYVHARLLWEADRIEAAAKAIQKALFLRQTSIMSHFLFGTIQMRRGQWESASRHLATARHGCASLSPDATVPLSDGMTAAQVAAAVESQSARLPPQDP